jgi:putative transposase
LCRVGVCWQGNSRPFLIRHTWCEKAAWPGDFCLKLMEKNKSLPKRKSPRLSDYDYALGGGYFVTIATHKHIPYFGEVVDDEMCLNAIGEIVQECWYKLPKHSPNVILDEFIVMPNHLHAILFINEQVVGGRHASPDKGIVLRARHASPLRKSKKGTLSTIIGSYKSAVTKRINQHLKTAGQSIWQRSFYDRVIRDEDDLHNLCNYIHYNVSKWMEKRDKNI